MEEKKRGIFQRIKDKWNGLEDKDKGYCIGCVITGFLCGILSGAMNKRMENAYIQASNDMLDAETKIAYQRGLQEGQTLAYYELLTSPEKSFRKMGMTDIGHF